MADEGTGAVGDRVTGLPPFLPPNVRRAMGGNHYVRRGDGVGTIRRALLDALRPESFTHQRVMGQLAENGQRPGESKRFGACDRVAHAETHSEMFREEDFHWLRDIA